MSIAIKHTTHAELLKSPQEFAGSEVVITGWIRTLRQVKDFGFIEVNDGSCYKNLQVVFDNSLTNFDKICKFTLGSSIEVRGKYVESLGAGQSNELKAVEINDIGIASHDYPVQKKRHTYEYLRTIAHLRPRTNSFMAVFRVRSLISYAIHQFFQERGFVYIHTPIVTGNDAEGAGEMFKISTLDFMNLPKDEKGKIDYSKELFGKETFLTVSGQLAVEPFCPAFRNVYTFGPTFRAENSNTARHANEFWMVEPEIAFAGLEEDMSLAEDMLKFIIKTILDKAPQEMEFFNERIEPELLSRLEHVLNSPFEVLTYTDAVKKIIDSGEQFEYPVKWGDNLQTEHERFLTEKIVGRPVFVIDYPKEIKAFYMKMNADNKTVRAMDCLVPGIGEIIGGSQREERLDVLTNRMIELGMKPEDYQFYLDLRKFGTFPHAGFGLGLERAVMYLTGMKNIRDVIPYPRTPNNVVF